MPFNLLVITMDDCNDFVGYLRGHPQASTPSMDAFVRSATPFLKAYSTVPLCNPARVAMWSGMLPQHTGVWGNNDHGEHVPSLFHHLQAHGYTTVRAGKVFHYDPDDCWTRELSGANTHEQPSPFPGIGVSLGKEGTTDAGELDSPREEHMDWQRAVRVSRWLEQAPAQPFCVALGLRLPHNPWYVPRPFLGMVPPAHAIQLPPAVAPESTGVPVKALAALDPTMHMQITQAGVWPQLVQGYLASLRFVDECIGRVLRSIDGTALAQNTVVVLASDNGLHLGERGHWYKAYPSERALHVPLVIRAPGVGRQMACAQPISMLGLAPTCCALLGIDPMPERDGSSFAGLVYEPGSLPPEWGARSWWHAATSTVRTRRWRLTRWGSDDTQLELYDHSIDPGEWRNLADDAAYAHVVDTLRPRL